MTFLGESLRRERLKQNLDYEVVSKELKISPRLLQAMEEERFDKLPGGVFARGFVRQYARLLGLDEDEAVSAAQRLVEPNNDVPAFAAEHAHGRVDAPREPRHVTKPVLVDLPRMDGWQAISDNHRSSTLTALALVVGVMLLCSVVYGWWQRDRHPGAKPGVAVAATTQPAAASALPSGSVASNPASSAPSPAPASTTPAETAGAATAEAAPAPNQSAEPVTPASATSASAAPVTPTPAGPVHVELTATEPVWVAAKSDGKSAFSGIIAANQTKTLDASDAAEIKVGNAGGVRILLNGKSIGEVGPHGQVRTIQFTSGGFHIVDAAPKVLEDPIGLL